VCETDSKSLCNEIINTVEILNATIGLEGGRGEMAQIMYIHVSK
jgi:hypothetical protein